MSLCTMCLMLCSVSVAAEEISYEMRAVDNARATRSRIYALRQRIQSLDEDVLNYKLSYLESHGHMPTGDECAPIEQSRAMLEQLKEELDSTYCAAK